MVKSDAGAAPPSEIPLKILPWGVAAVGLVVTYLAYAPGLVPNDAKDQLRQAQTGHFVDTHPAIMAWLWSKTNAVIPGPEGFFLLLIALYWAGFFLLVRNLLRVDLVRAIIASVLPFSPLFFNFAGTIWKDVLVFGCFLVATGIILARPSYGTARFRPVPTLIVLILLLLGCLARWNSMLAAVPIVVLGAWPLPPATAPLRRTLRRLALCAPIVLLVWAVSGKALDVTVFHAEKAGFANMLPVWDLIGMSNRLGENLLPGSWSEEQFATIRSCYTPGNLNDLSEEPCAFIYKDLTKNGYWRAAAIFPLWFNQILRHPEAYLDTRLSYVHRLFWPNVVFMFDADDETSANNHHPGRLFQAEKRLLRFCRIAPVLQFLFTLGFWMIAAAILTAGFAIAVARGRPGCYPSLLLSVSAGANLWPLVVIGPDGQLRYAYWSIAAISIALLIAGRDVARAGAVGAKAATTVKPGSMSVTVATPAA